MGARKRMKKATKRGATRPRTAQAAGKQLAEHVLAFRAAQRKKRAAAVRALVAAEAPMTVAALRPERVLAVAGAPASAGTVVAEGDSWFDYPFHDVLRMLEDEHAYDVQSVAHKGDRVEDMAFSGGQLEELARLIEKLLRNGTVPRAILLSGGGNDIAGTEFGMLLDHAASPTAGWNEEIVAGVIDQRIADAYVAIVTSITAVAQHYIGHPIPIVTHGYDYPVPDGRGFLGGFLFLPGPWLRPGFYEKGFKDQRANTTLMQALIDRFNAMVQSTSSRFAHVHYIDLRGTLPNDGKYKTYWDNELHPTKLGFQLVANRFAQVIRTL